MLSKRRIGTLEGQSRQKVYEGNINTDNEVTQNLLEQPYNELESINKGGKVIINKNNKTKRKKRKHLIKNKKGKSSRV